VEGPASAQTVSSVADLAAAAGDAGVRRIVVAGEIAEAPSLRLREGQQLVGADDSAALVFADGVDGVRLRRDNLVERIALRVGPARRAVFNDTTADDMGVLRLANVTTHGQVQIVARDRARAGQVVVEGLHIAAADTRGQAERPHLSGVGVLQGAFTLWYLQPDGAAVLRADLRGISAGRAGAPVRGSGVFVAGAGDSGGRLEVSRLETGPIYTDGGIAEGTHDTISGGVFVVHGAHVREVRNSGPVMTYGVNDMVLDNWGRVDAWTAEAALTSYGRSGVGFVNFGSIGVLRIAAPIETYGVGARGFNVYRLDDHAGPTVETAEFDRVTTHADAAVGIQVGQPIGRLIVHGGITTHGGAGDSLVRGAIVRLSAHALSIQAGGRVGSVEVHGPISSAGAGVAAVDISGEVGAMTVAGGIRARGAGTDAIHVDGGTFSLHDTTVISADGVPIRLTDATIRELRDVRACGPVGSGSERE